MCYQKTTPRFPIRRWTTCTQVDVTVSLSVGWSWWSSVLWHCFLLVTDPDVDVRSSSSCISESPEDERWYEDWGCCRWSPKALPISPCKYDDAFVYSNIASYVQAVKRAGERNRLPWAISISSHINPSPAYLSACSFCLLCLRSSSHPHKEIEGYITHVITSKS